MKLRRGYKIALSIIAGVLVISITIPFWVFFLTLGVSQAKPIPARSITGS